jgi:uncharacterized membrane protein YhaH (DUF805 family)
MDFGRVLYPNYHDRSNRLEFLVQYIVFNVFIFFILQIAQTLETSINPSLILPLILPLFILAMAYLVIASRKRLNDLGDSCWLVLLLFVPIVNWFFHIYLLFVPGKKNLVQST